MSRFMFLRRFGGRIRSTKGLERSASSGSNQFTPQTKHFDAEFAGIATMLRLPALDSYERLSMLDACFVGIPMDIGTSNRSGTRHGPRSIRDASTAIGPCSRSTGATPFDSLRVADVGDIAVNPYNLLKAIEDITREYKKIVSTGVIPLTLGGDHTLTFPILRAMKERHGPVGLVHVDAHADTSDTLFGEKIAHGTPFRRAVEEGLLDCERVVQIGLRGSGYTLYDDQWGRDQGFTVVPVEECWHKSLAPLMDTVRSTMADKPVYLSFDIDGIDPGLCPGTGTPEIGGLTVIQGLEIVRGCKGLNIVGGDLVEVNPLFDRSGCTAVTGANLLFEMLCILRGNKS